MVNISNRVKKTVQKVRERTEKIYKGENDNNFNNHYVPFCFTGTH